LRRGELGWVVPVAVVGVVEPGDQVFDLLIPVLRCLFLMREIALQFEDALLDFAHLVLGMKPMNVASQGL
jgi:hypothetical protein